MAAISFPVTGLQPVPQEQLAQPPANTGGPQAVDPNQQDAPQGDTVTISATFPPAHAVQQPGIVKLENFSVFSTQTQVQTTQNTATANNPAAAPGLATQPPVQNQTAAQAAAAANDPATAAFTAAAGQAGTASTPQQELVQLDQTLQQLGIDPQSISLFNRMGLLLYANDPVALQNLVHAMQTADQQLGTLGQLGAAANAATTTNQTLAAQNQLPSALQAQAQNQQAAQGTAQVTPEPLTPIQGSAPAQAQATPVPQVQAQDQNAPAQNQPAANGPANSQPAQPNNLLLNTIQEFQQTFQAVEAQTNQQPVANSNSQNGQGQALNVLF